MAGITHRKHEAVAYEVKDKVAIVTGAGSGINHALTRILLQQGCSVVMADLRLLPEAEATLREYQHTPEAKGKPSAIFFQIDLANWAQLQELFDTALETYGTVNIVVNGAGIYEPPTSSFWQPPGVSPAARDKSDCNPGVYQTYAVNTMAPIRLAQIAVDYWFRHPDAEMDFDGNLVWMASVCGYVHLMQSPLYFSSKAAIISMAKCLSPLRRTFGIRNSVVCPGPVKTPIYDADYCKAQLHPTDIALTAEEAAQETFKVMTEPQYGDGNVIEIVAAASGSIKGSMVKVREVVLEALYPNPALEGNHIMEEEQNFINVLKKLVYVG